MNIEHTPVVLTFNVPIKLIQSIIDSYFNNPIIDNKSQIRQNSNTFNEVISKIFWAKCTLDNGNACVICDPSSIHNYNSGHQFKTYALCQFRFGIIETLRMCVALHGFEKLPKLSIDLCIKRLKDHRLIDSVQVIDNEFYIESIEF
jgi:hypothetical protein